MEVNKIMSLVLKHVKLVKALEKINVHLVMMIRS